MLFFDLKFLYNELQETSAEKISILEKTLSDLQEKANSNAEFLNKKNEVLELEYALQKERYNQLSSFKSLEGIEELKKEVRDIKRNGKKVEKTEVLPD